MKANQIKRVLIQRALLSKKPLFHSNLTLAHSSQKPQLLNVNQILTCQSRHFFNKKPKEDKNKEQALKDEAEAKKMQDSADEQQAQNDKKAAVEENQNESDQSKEEDQNQNKSEEAAETGSDEEEGKEFLTAKERKLLDEMLKEQDDKIADHESKIEEHQKTIKDLEQKVIYQMAENDNTVKRYRKQIEDSKKFAVSNFAKELLEVRDSLGLALQHTDLDKIKESEDIDHVKKQLENIVQGQEMTSKVFDKTLAKFDVVGIDPLGEKFDPNIHDAIFTIPAHDSIEHNHIGQVIQTGWKIGDRVLRAAKVGIVKSKNE